jgi:hypothetical protein
MPKKEISKSLEVFTNIYPISKTLRFELKPIENTENMLKQDNIIEIDKNRRDSYIRIKPYLDDLHRCFIKESLSEKGLKDLGNYFEIYKEYRSNKKKYLEDKKKEGAKKSLDRSERKLSDSKKWLRKEILSLFNIKAEEWSEENLTGSKVIDGPDLLSQKQVFEILKNKYGNIEETFITDPETGEKSSIFDGWKDFTGYFNKFFETRRNLYKDDGTATAIPTRIIDQNLDRFLENKIIWEEKIKNIIDVESTKEIEKETGLNKDEAFSVDHYNQCMLQTGIDKYNEFIGGKTLETGKKIKGVNEIINEYKQVNKDKKIPFLKKLDKQILSEKEKFLDEIEDEKELLQMLKGLYNVAREKFKTLANLLEDFFCNPQKYNLEEIYISKQAYNTISRMWTDNTDAWNENLHQTLKKDKIASSSDKKKDGTYNFKDFISLEYIKRSLENLEIKEGFWKDKYYENNLIPIKDRLKEDIWEDFLKIFDHEFKTLLSKYKDSEKDLENLFRNFRITKENKLIIKSFADDTLHTYQMSKYFALERKRSWDETYNIDSEFYNHVEYGFKDMYYNGAYEEIIQPYNKIRNFLTKKQYNEEKWKLNFENPTFADGWDRNKEADNTAIILRKDGKYYLGVMKKSENRLFDERNIEKYCCKDSKNCYEKLVYKQMADPKKDFPKGIFSRKGKNIYKPSKKILEIYENETFKTGDSYSEKDLWDLIDFYKECIPQHPSWKIFDFEFSDTRKYKNIGEFYEEVNKNSYKISFESVSEDYIKSINKGGKLYLFQIYNKDFSDHSKGKKNLHTMYFKELFSQNNAVNNFPFKLNGQAEVFYRPATDKSKLVSKKDKRGKTVLDKKRYAENKILFHVPITLNRTSAGSSNEVFNEKVNNFLKNNNNINVIGLDRGEKHLVYYSVIDKKGNILKTGSFNKINNTDYHQKLTERAEKRKGDRQNWDDVQNIKDLKKGYISKVVREIADLCIENNAIIVMEDLNTRFKQIRSGIEKSVYQQLEKALIEKLNYLVDKDETNPNKTGHMMKAYQLTAPFDTFKNMGKQTGLIFYTQASYTSQTDPLTGWRKNIYLKYSNAERAQKDILNFSSIKYNENKRRFEFTYKIKNFTGNVPNKNSDAGKLMGIYEKEWVVCSNVERFRWNKNKNNNKGDYDHYDNITNNLIVLFDAYNINYKDDILRQVREMDRRGNEKFFKDIIFYFNLICQIRNTQDDEEGDKNDFILSPVEPFFDSRDAEKFSREYNNEKKLPKNGDENGAYNIARKGLIILKKISDFSEGGKIKWDNIYISNDDWDLFLKNNSLI